MFRSQLTSVIFVLFFSLPPIYGYFEYMQLVLTWPPAFCHIKRCRRTPNNFTIHGLWPDNYSTMLNFCTDDEFVKFTDDDKKDKLDKRWPDLITDEADCKGTQDFWKREYEKHGTCCLSSYNQEQYFELAMVLKDRFDLVKSFRNHGIIPGTAGHTVQKINNTVKAITQGFPNLACTKALELKEIGICFDRTGKNVINCPHPRTCKQTRTGIKFP
uniref:SB1-ribonuclease n=1 Tax=Petunia hybrida TaxID=4102 RepID=Q9S819_PETHY|nr:SB1-ribonuclease precursor [Petunia x hybrida]CAB66089.1 Sv-ribonuclease precursor [Petunia x hybrida]